MKIETINGAKVMTYRQQFSVGLQIIPAGELIPTIIVTKTKTLEGEWTPVRIHLVKSPTFKVPVDAKHYGEALIIAGERARELEDDPEGTNSGNFTLKPA